MQRGLRRCYCPNLTVVKRNLPTTETYHNEGAKRLSIHREVARSECDGEAYGEDVDRDADEHELERERAWADGRERHHHVLHKEVHGDAVQDSARDGVLDEERHEAARDDERRRGAVRDYEVAEEAQSRGGESAFAGALAEDAAGDSLQQRNRLQSKCTVDDERGDDIEDAAEQPGPENRSQRVAVSWSRGCGVHVPSTERRLFAQTPVTGFWLVTSVNSVVEMDDAIGKLFGREQRELDVAVARRDERDPFADEDRDHVDAELVDFAGVEEGSVEFAAAHHPNVFARLRAQALHERLDRFADELDSRLDLRLDCRRERFARLPREDVVLHAWTVNRKFQSHVYRLRVGFAAPEDGVDGFEKCGHAVVALGMRAVEPVDAAVGARDEAVGADGDVDDGLAASATRRAMPFRAGLFCGAFFHVLRSPEIEWDAPQERPERKHASRLHAIAHEDAAVLERVALEQLEVDLAAGRVKQRDAGAEQHGMDVEADLIDQAGFEERVGEFAASHQTDVLARLVFQAPDEIGGVAGDDSDVAMGFRRERLRENIGLHARVRGFPLAVVKRHFVGFSAHEDGVDRLPVGGHDRGGFVAPEQPIDGIIFASEEIVEAVGAAESDFAHVNLRPGAGLVGYR